MQKEDWINEVLESGRSLNAEPSPFLYERILNRIQLKKQPEEGVRPRLKWALAIASVLIISINLVSVIRIREERKTEQQQVSNGNDYNHSVVYSY